MMGYNKKLIHGVGINDATYVIQKCIYLDELLPSGNKKTKVVWACPYYERWKGMLRRCYSNKVSKSLESYKDCSVCEEWLTFSNFRKWMVTKDWKDKHLDKDLLVEGNKVYSSENCMFIPSRVNHFIKESIGSRGQYLLGVCWRPKSQMFEANCNNPFKMDGDDRSDYIGLFDTELQAHLAWKCRKYQYTLELIHSGYVDTIIVKDLLVNKYKFSP